MTSPQKCDENQILETISVIRFERRGGGEQDTNLRNYV
jgi:hypothetical protein